MLCRSLLSYSRASTANRNSQRKVLLGLTLLLIRSGEGRYLKKGGGGIISASEASAEYVGLEITGIILAVLLICFITWRVVILYGNFKYYRSVVRKMKAEHKDQVVVAKARAAARKEQVDLTSDSEESCATTGDIIVPEVEMAQHAPEQAPVYVCVEV